MPNLVSVIIPTYNPDAGRLGKTLAALQQQTLPLPRWELIIVDNNSTLAVTADLGWHPNSKIVHEQKQGLTRARLKGFMEARGRFMVLVDDDNLLDPNYLQQVLAIFMANPKLGTIGGKSLPLFESAPPYWLKEFYGNLALRDLGDIILTCKWENNYPPCAPIGAGMAVKKEALQTYIQKISTGTSFITDRTGSSLSSGGDNDMVLEILKAGWEAGYFPRLSLQHIIPAQRMQKAYLARLLNNTNNSWVKLLESHHINPWKKINKKTLPLRKIKAWFKHKAFVNKINYIKWRGYCGTADALAEI